MPNIGQADSMKTLWSRNSINNKTKSLHLHDILRVIYHETILHQGSFLCFSSKMKTKHPTPLIASYASCMERYIITNILKMASSNDKEQLLSQYYPDNTSYKVRWQAWMGGTLVSLCMCKAAASCTTMVSDTTSKTSSASKA